MNPTTENMQPMMPTPEITMENTNHIYQSSHLDFEINEVIDFSIPENRNLTVTVSQLARICDTEIRIESRCGCIGCANDYGAWTNTSIRDDGQYAIDITKGVFFIAYAHPLMEALYNTVSKEARLGQHSQQSLDKALEDVAMLMPCEHGLVNAHALYSFFKEGTSFYNWCDFIIINLTMDGPIWSEGMASHQESERLKECRKRGSETDFRINAELAMKVALASGTKRGDVMRLEFLALEKSLKYLFLGMTGNCRLKRNAEEASRFASRKEAIIQKLS
jgi:phage anti-repressor protein